MKILVGILLLIAFVAAHEKCERKWKKVGCFRDKLKAKRALPEEVLNRRDVTSESYDGHMISWKKYPESLHGLYCKCAEIAKQKGYTHFALQFYGECWTGSMAGKRYKMHGPSQKCIGGDYKKCDDAAETECIGGRLEYYVYQLVEEKAIKAKDLPRINGGYSQWESWSNCSKPCGGGVRLRSRSCVNPAPLNGGKDCSSLGKPEELGQCNVHPCKSGCNKAIDLGIIMDASSSVRRKNYNKMKGFLRAMADDFDVSPTGTHFGVIHYSSYARLDFQPNDSRYHHPAILKAKISSIVYSYGGTRTDKALRLAEKKFFCDSCGRDGVPKVLLVLTDGNTNQGSEDLGVATKNMKESGVVILSLGIGKGISMSELQLIASEPKSKHVYKCTDFDELKTKLSDIISHACLSHQ